MTATKTEFRHLEMSFFGVGLHLRACDEDLSDAKFLYEQFLAPVSDPEVVVEISCIEWPDRGFFTSLLSKDRLLKRISVNACGNRSKAKDAAWSFRTWSEQPSPLPPLGHSSLSLSTATTPGAVVRISEDVYCLLTGDNYVGKTSVALALCAQGAELVTDNMAIFDTYTGRVHTYETPLGFRRRGLVEIIPRLSGWEHRLTVSPDTGLVALVKPVDVLGKHNVRGGKISTHVRIQHGEASLSQWIRTPELPWFTSSHQFRQDMVLPEKTLQITTAKESKPHDTAEVIQRSLSDSQRGFLP